MTIVSQILYQSTFFIYLCAVILYFSFFLLQKHKLNIISYWVTVIGFILHTLAFALRWKISGFIPIASIFEALSFFSWTIILTAILAEYRHKQPIITAITATIGLIFISLASLHPSAIHPLAPALQSLWLKLHVSMAIIGEAAFGFAFVCSIIYHIKKSFPEKFTQNLPTKEILDKLTYKSIAIGLPVFTIGALIFGSIWAYRAWGTYWNWDPKETWSLITFLVYILYLHMRLQRGWKAEATTWIAIIGFLVAVFTFLGVNYLMTGMHSYQ